MSLFKSRRQNTVLVGTTSFRYSSDAKAYFSEKYGFVGEQLQKLCAGTGLMRVAAEVDTGEWFKETYDYHSGKVYKKRDCIKIAATSKEWKVIVDE